MKNKVVIITGGSSGIGKGLAEAFGEQGSKVVITGRRKAPLDDVANSLKKQGMEVLAIQADASVEADNQRMVEEVLAKYGQIDVLINNAGISMRALFEELDLEVMQKVMDINFWGVVYATKYCLPHIMKSKGSVVGVSAIASYRGLPARAGYCASKFALNGFLEVLRTEMLKKGVHVLTACPGFTSSNIRKTALLHDGSQQGDTPRNEEKMMSAEECGRRIYTATKKRKNHLILTTQGVFTVFLNKLFPSLMDKIVYNVMAKEANAPFK